MAKGLDINLLSQAAEDLQDRLESVKNVREVNLGGQRDEVIHVQMIPSRLTTLGISASQVRNAIQGGNIDRSWDLVRDEEFGAQVRLYGRFRTLDDLRELPITRLDDDRVVRLSEVAEVYKGLERETQRAFVSWEGSEFSPTINLEVVKVAGTDTIQVIDDVLADMELASQDPSIWPFGMSYRVLTNDANTIRNELANPGQQCTTGIPISICHLVCCPHLARSLNRRIGHSHDLCRGAIYPVDAGLYPQHHGDRRDDPGPGTAGGCIYPDVRGVARRHFCPGIKLAQSRN